MLWVSQPKSKPTNFIAPSCSQAIQTCRNDTTGSPSTPGATIVSQTAIYVRVPPTTVSVNISKPASILTPCQQLAAALL